MAQRKDDLLDWYLAHLRKNALNRKNYQDLTPMALVDSDKEMLKRAVEDTVKPDDAPPPVTAANTGLWMIQLGATLVVSAILLLVALSAS